MTETEGNQFVIQVVIMLEVQAQDQQLWVVERLYRICSVFRSCAGMEPCLEQYESQVRMILDEEITPAAAAWIELIAQSLRSGATFQPREYLVPGDANAR